MIETRSANHIANTFTFICYHLFEIRDNELAPSKAVELESLLWYLQSVRNTGNEYMFHHVRQWYIASVDRLIQGFDAETAYALNELKIRGNKKGFAVLSEDPEDGPLSSFEEAALRRALIRDDGPIEERAALWLALAFGSNPANLALLQEGDFLTQSFENGTPSVHTVQMPRIKKREPERSSFKTRFVDEPLAAIILTLINRNKTLSSDTRYARPLFRLPRRRRVLDKGPLWRLAYHPTAGNITELISRCVSRLGVVSPRTMKLLHVTTRRLRYTYASKMVRQGVAPRDLAELLDHSDLQNVLVYYKGHDRLIERLDPAVAEQIGPLVRAFMGTIVDREKNSGDQIPFHDLPSLGRCTASFICGQSPHKSCYTCLKFTPFADGPHEAVLESVIAEQDQMLIAGFDHVAEQLSETILAIGEVVAKIKEQRS